MLYVVYISINLISISKHIHIQNTLRNSAWEGATQPSELVDAMSQMLEADVGRFLCLVWEFRGKLIRIAHEKWRIHWNLMDFWVELMVWDTVMDLFLTQLWGWDDERFIFWSFQYTKSWSTIKFGDTPFSIWMIYYDLLGRNMLNQSTFTMVCVKEQF